MTHHFGYEGLTTHVGMIQIIVRCIIVVVATLVMFLDDTFRPLLLVHQLPETTAEIGGFATHITNQWHMLHGANVKYVSSREVEKR